MTQLFSPFTPQGKSYIAAKIEEADNGFILTVEAGFARSLTVFKTLDEVFAELKKATETKTPVISETNAALVAEMLGLDEPEPTIN